MDDKRNQLIKQLYDLANDKAKVDDWLNSLDEAIKDSKRISTECNLNAVKLKAWYDNLSKEEQESRGKEYTQKCLDACQPVFAFYNNYRDNFADLFRMQDYDYDTKQQFLLLFEQLTTEIK